MTYPQLTHCCGHHFCQSCLHGLQSNAKPCPFCKEGKVDAVLNKSLQRTIQSLAICCPHKRNGCAWKGQVGGAENHLRVGEREGECLYVRVPCGNECGTTLDRNILKRHEDENCLQKKDFDPAEVTRRLQSTIRKNEDLSAQLAIVKEESEESSKRIAVLEQQLKVAFIEISMLKKRDVSGSIPPEVKSGVSNGVAAASHDFESYLRIVPYEFTFPNYKEQLESAGMWMTKPFFTEQGGYKICVRVAPQGLGNGEKTHVSVHVYLMKGEYDNMLQWPFRGYITIQLLNQLKDDNHFEQKVNFTDSTPSQYCCR